MAAMRIGTLTLDPPLILAPMAGVNDRGFRRLCRRAGAALVFCEFVSADGAVVLSDLTLERTRFDAQDRPIGVQLFGDDPRVLERAARTLVESIRPDVLDLNFGCPVPKVTKKGAGAAALQDLGLMRESAAAVVAGAGSVPVTVKMRIGWDAEHVVVPTAGPLLQAAGIQAIALHARTSCDRYDLPADWRHIAELKAAVTIPVIGNGDAIDPTAVVTMREQTGCDGVMVGRAALGNPWVFAAMAAAWRGQPAPMLDPRRMAAEMREHAAASIADKGPVRGVLELRKHFAALCERHVWAAPLRRALLAAPDAHSLAAVLDALEAAAAAATELDIAAPA